LLRSNRSAAADGTGTAPVVASGRAPSGRRATLGEANRVANGDTRRHAPALTASRTLTASGGQPIDSAEKLHRDFADAINRSRPGRNTIGHVVYDFPESRRISDDLYDTDRKIDVVLSE